MCVIGGWGGEGSESGRCNPEVLLEELNPIKDPNDSLFLQWHHTRMPPSCTQSLWAGSWDSGLPWKMPHRKMAVCGSSLALTPVRACVWPLLVASTVLLFPTSRAHRAALNFCSPKESLSECNHSAVQVLSHSFLKSWSQLYFYHGLCSYRKHKWTKGWLCISVWPFVFLRVCCNAQKGPKRQTKGSCFICFCHSWKILNL